MKNLIGWLIIGSAATFGHKIGKWFWEEVMEEKMNNFKDRLKSKKGES